MCEGDEAMDDDLFVAGRIDSTRKICISQLSPRSVDELDIRQLGSKRGYYIYEVDERPDGGGIRVLAKVASIEAAYRLIDIWRSVGPRLGALSGSLTPAITSSSSPGSGVLD